MNKKFLVGFLFFTFSLSGFSASKEEPAWVYSKDGMIGVCAQKDGLHIHKKVSSRYTDISIYVENITNPQKPDDSLFILEATASENSYVYPFVKKGQKYKVYLGMDTSRSMPTVYSKAVEITAAGGQGEASLSSKVKEKSYNSSEWTVTFDQLNIKIPSKAKALPVTGYVITKKETVYHPDFELKDKKIILKQVMRTIRGKTFYLRLNYYFEYEGNVYRQRLINNKENQFTDTNTTVNTQKTGLTEIRINTANGKAILDREKYVKAKMKAGSAEYEMEIRGRGNSSWGSMPKHNYNIKLTKKASVLGFKENKKWVLISNYTDKTLIRNTFSFFLGHKIFNKFPWNPDFKPVNLYINDEYLGVYLFGERITVNKNRVDIQLIDSLKKDINKDKKIDINDGGFILEINRREDEEFNFRSAHDVSFSLKEPEKVNKEAQNYVKQKIKDAENALFGKDFADPKKGYAAYLDVDSFIDWYLINEFNKNVDSGWYSSIYLVYNPKDKKFYMGPLWDYDLSFGNVDYNDCDKAEGFYIKTRNVWYARLFKDPEFCKKVKSRWNQKKAELLKALDAEVDKMILEINEASYYNFERWPILGVTVWPNPLGAEKRRTMKSEIDYLKEWMKRRFEWMDREVNNL